MVTVEIVTGNGTYDVRNTAVQTHTLLLQPEGQSDSSHFYRTTGTYRTSILLYYTSVLHNHHNIHIPNPYRMPLQASA
jgi:hypothetical protein